MNNMLKRLFMAIYIKQIKSRVTKKDIFQIIRNSATQTKTIDLSDTIIQDLILREKDSSTRIAKHTVMPHVIADYVQKNMILIIRLDHPVQWLDKGEVQTIIVLLIRQNDSYLETFLEMCCDELFLKELSQAQYSVADIQLLIDKKEK
ncbi:hypothetical protein EFM09_01980 [Latilactobacillus curvatus]|nr:hypothetical protein [Latilactobacillus curvatus]